MQLIKWKVNYRLRELAMKYVVFRIFVHADQIPHFIRNISCTFRHVEYVYPSPDCVRLNYYCRHITSNTRKSAIKITSLLLLW
jgi:hypothetical protein